MPLKSKYSASDLLSVLKCMLKPQGERRAEGRSQPYFYTGTNHNIVVLPPVADTEGFGLEQFHQTLKKLFTYCKAKNISVCDKHMVFPVVQGQTIFGMPRRHLVTLHYDPSTRIATILDSRPCFAGFLYPLEALKTSLSKGLDHAGLSLGDVVVKYQATQWDDIHCGAWTVTNIVALSEGITVEAQKMALSRADGPPIVTHNIRSVHEKAGAPYSPIAGIKANALTPKSSAEDLSSDYVDVGEVVGFSDMDKATFIQTAQEIFHRCFSSPEALANALIARENITFNGKKLNIDDIDTVSRNLDEMFLGLEAAPMEAVAPQVQGYRLFNVDYVNAKLRAIGFDEAILDTMSLADKLRYDAALCLAEANAGHVTAMGFLFEGQEAMSETMLDDAQDENQAFKVVLAAYLKEAVLQQREKEHSTATIISTAALASAALLPEYRNEESPVSITQPFLSSVPVPTPVSTPVERAEHAQETSSNAISIQLMFGIALAGGVLLLAISLALANPIALGVGAAVTAVGGIGLMYGLFSDSAEEENNNSPSVHTASSGF